MEFHEALKSLASKTVRQTSTFANFSMQDTRLNSFRRNFFLTQLECISKVSTQFIAPWLMWPRLPTINYFTLQPQ